SSTITSTLHKSKSTLMYYIQKDIRTLVIWVLSGLSIAGVVVFLVLPNPPKASNDEVRTEEPTPGPVEVYLDAMKLFITPRMLMLCVSFLHSGKSYYHSFLWFMK
ncbi:hypothetical protein HHI36_022437, partial [Cryptolaemus montrouzieri]